MAVLWIESYSALDYVWVGTRPIPTTHGYRGFTHWLLRLGYGGIYVERIFNESRNEIYLASACQSGTARENR
jgi:hypothetical protein